MIYVFLLALAACHDGGNNKDQVVKAEEPLVETIAGNQVPDSLSPLAKDTIPYNIQVDSVIHIAIPHDSTSVSVKGHLDKEGGPVICYLQAGSGIWLHAGLLPEKKNTNIRFSHIYMPDGKSDGPFGQTMKYELREKGVYKLYIAPNQMAGDKPQGSDFTLTIKMKK